MHWIYLQLRIVSDETRVTGVMGAYLMRLAGQISRPSTERVTQITNKAPPPPLVPKKFREAGK